jgi:hypothetical protein
MVTPDGTLLLIVLGAVAIFLTFATIKGWLRWKGGSPITSMTAFHDFQPKDKQEAIEYVMEAKAGKKIEEQERGEGNNSETRKTNLKINSNSKNSKSEIRNLKSTGI